MRISFPAQAYLEHSEDPVLDGILSECGLEAEITVGCELGEEGAQLEEIEVDRVIFCHDDHSVAVKAKFFLNETLMGTIKAVLVREVEGNWDRYAELAWQWEQGEIEAAMDRMYELGKDR